MRRGFALLLLSTFVFLFSYQRASAEKRVALVLGNSAYINVPMLKNPANDSAAMATLFRNAKFDVVEARQDLRNVDTRNLLRQFSEKVQDADVAVVYYAGHGIEVDGMNYMVPIDAVLKHDTDAFDEAIPLDRVLQLIAPAKQLRLVILDACRDNPFAQTMKRSVASRSLDRGLAGVEPDRPNTFIAFAAKAGSIAEDGDGAHSPFTTALLQHLTTPGLDIRKALGFVRDDVMAATNNRQEPFVYGSLGGHDVALVPSPVAAQVLGSPQEQVRFDYELALQLGTRIGWQSFLSHYPSGYYSDLAKGQLDKIAIQEAKQTSPAKPLEPDKTSASADKATAPQTSAALGESANPGAMPSSDQNAGNARKRAEFSFQDAINIARLAALRQFDLPDYGLIEIPPDLPMQLARFIGVWATTTGFADGRGKQAMIIICSVDKSGRAEGYYLTGSPKATSLDKSPPWTIKLLGQIEGQALTFKFESSSYRVEVWDRDELSMTIVRNDGLVPSAVFQRVWTLDGTGDLTRFVANSIESLDIANSSSSSIDNASAGSKLPGKKAALSIPEGDLSSTSAPQAPGSCANAFAKCQANCARISGRADCSITVCPSINAQCLSTGCWRGRNLNACGLAKK